MAKGHATLKAPKGSIRGGAKLLKKINIFYKELKVQNPNKEIRVMFQDEAGFGRINKPKRCWCSPGVRPSTPCHHIREYRYVYGAVEPRTGDSCFWIIPYCNTACMNFFLEKLSNQYADDMILLICDGARWHKANALKIPDNIRIAFIPPYTPEMNPIEQIWKEIRKRGFRNEVFSSLNAVMARLAHTMKNLSPDTIKSITGRKWILSMF